MRFQSLLKTLVFLVIIMMVIPASAQFREIERIDLRNLNFEGLYGIATHHEAERIYVLNFRADVIFILNEEMDDVIDQIALQEPNTIYGMDFNVGDNTFWLADRIANPQIIYHYDLDGELLDDFQAGGAANSVTFCPENGHLYVVCHPGGIIELTVEGEEVDRFQGNLSLTAVDYYPPNGTLIIMDGADRIYEYSLEGELIETIMQQDAIEGNGLGLDYDPWTRTLYTTGQEGVVQIWEDNYSALPEPQIEPEAIQAAIGFGLDGEETLTITNVGEEESNLRFSLNDVGEGVDWLDIDPESGVLELDEEAEITLSYATEELEPGIFERIIIVRTNNPEFFEVEVPFELTVISGFGSLTGTVIDAAYDSPVEGAVISIPRFGFEAITDEEGTYLFEEVPEWIYIVEIHAVNYHPQTVEDIEVVEDETTELNFSLLHSECNPSTRNIFRALEPDFRQTVEFDIDNDGNAPLTWRVERTLPENVDRELWELRVESNTEELVGDDMINGVTFAEGHFYISGGNNGGNPNMIYVFDSEGEQVGEFEQAHESRYGMRDLTYDGELIWGSDENVLYGYSLEGEHVETLQGEAQSYRSVTWDPVNERFWSADITSNIFATNRQGNLVQTINRPGDIRIYGLGFWPDDPDGHCLYVFSRGDEIDVAVYKINLDNGESILAAEFDVGGSRPGGIHITNLLDVYSWVLMGIVQTPDRMMVWQLSTNRAWFRISPEDGEIAAGESQHFELILDATDIPTETTMEGFLVFTHDGNGYETIISVTLRVEEGEVQTFRELDLHVGWNTVSVNLQPDDHENIRGLMSALVEENLLIMMKNGAGEFYIPEYDFSNIRGWFAPQGYQLKMRGEAIFRLDGMSVLRDAEISLSEGWQLISYYPRFPIEATVALSGIEEHLIIAKDGYGNFYIPDWDFSNMGDMREGQGYYINVDSGIVLVYRTERPDDEGAFAGVRHSSVYDEPGQLPVHAVTGVNMSLLVLSDSPLLLQGGSKGGCEIGVYANNQLIGSGVLQNGVCGIAVWGDDPSTDETDGALEGLSFEIRLLTGEGGLSTPEYTVLAGEAVYTTDGFAVVQLTASSVMPVEFGINSAYPNPFNSVMRISYGLVEAGDVSLNVYDLTGRHVVELVNGYFKTGMHVAVLDGIDLSSGLYMLRLESGSDVSQMKVVLVK